MSGGAPASRSRAPSRRTDLRPLVRHVPATAGVIPRCGELRGGERGPLSAQGFLDALGARASDALVDRQGPLEVGRRLAGVVVMEVAVTDSFQSACLLQGCADLPGDGQRLAVVVAGPAGGRRPGR